MKKIYLVEDERNLANIIKKYLIREEYEVEIFYDGDTAIQRVGDDVDLWILDIMLNSDVSGYDLIKAIKESGSSASVIFTSARDQDLDKIMGLELGSDDYLAKPYSPRELILRVKAILKRKLSSKTIDNILNYENYEINVDKREVRTIGEQVKLTNKEFELLLFFVKNRKNIFERTEIIKKIWGDTHDGNDRVVDDLLRRLRQKMPNLRIETIYGLGYRLL